MTAQHRLWNLDIEPAEIPELVRWVDDLHN
jgi:hypothetical protein